MRPIGFANLLGVYEDCSPNGFYQRWKQKNAFHEGAGRKSFGIGSTDHFIDAVEQTVDQRRAETEWKHADAWKKRNSGFWCAVSDSGDVSGL